MTHSAQDVLTKAADLIEARGWFQTSMKGAKLCANLAIGDGVRAFTSGSIRTSPDYKLLNDAQQRMVDHLALTPDQPTTAIDYDPCKGRAIIAWNDTPGRTKAEVVAALRGAAKEANA